MRRLAAVALLLAVAVAGLAMTGATSEGEKTYRVDAVFYNAAHLVPGQLVKIAGAEVGQVEDVKLTSDHRARVQMTIDERFGPFRGDARCRIRPQSLIGEKFVQCDPGTPRAPALRARGDEAPTVPVHRNEVPVDLDLIFASLRLPYRERLSLIVNELGTGLAGRPQELNDAIRLANPALAETRRVLAILGDDRARLGRLIDSSDRVIGQLARRRGQVRSFVERAGIVADEVASRRGDLGTAIDRLPPMLDELEPTAASLATVTGQARPVLRDLRAAAPGVRALARDLGPLNDAARPALIRLADMSRTGRRAVRAATPIAELLKPVTRRLPPITRRTTALFESMRAMGVVEGLQGFVYFASLATSRFDRYSHILPSYQIGGSCNQAATEPVPGCDAHFAGSRENPGRVNDARARRRDGRPQVTGDRSQVTGQAPGDQDGDRGRARRRSDRARSGGRNRGPVTRHLSPVTPDPPRDSAPTQTLLDFLLGP